MTKPPKPTLEQLLEKWQPALPPDAPLEPQVWRQLGRAEARRGRKVAFALYAVACAALALFFSEWRISRIRRQMTGDRARQYLQLIDPLLGMKPDSLEAELSWIRSDLRLSPAQFAQIKKLHKDSIQRLLALNAEVVTGRREVGRLEELRRTTDQVDFLAYARLTDERMAIDRECRDSTRRLILATVELMTPGQRTQYLRYVQSALDHTAGAARD